MERIELWIGLAELKPLDRKAFGAGGAFTNIVASACSVEEFRKKASEIAAMLDMCVMEVDDAEPLSERRKKCSLTEEVDEMVMRAESDPNAIVYGTFHTYPFDEA